MKVICGTDIIEIDRVRKSIENVGDKFIETIFSDSERKYCESHGKMKYQHYAARFAGKEAIYKAFYGVGEKLTWLDAEVVSGDDGRPFVRLLKDLNVKVVSMDISLSHCKEYAVATFICWIEEKV